MEGVAVRETVVLEDTVTEQAVPQLMEPPEEVTVPPVVGVTVRVFVVGGIKVKLATTLLALLISSEQLAVPVQAPLQPLKV